MFGFKIISKSKLNDLQSEVNKNAQRVLDAARKLEKLTADIESLRKQNSELRLKNSKLYESNAELLQQANGLVSRLKKRVDVEFSIIDCKQPCDFCRHEFRNCKKLTFGDKTVCVIPKPSFRASTKKKS